MADISLVQEISMDESDEGVYMWPSTEEEILPPLSRVLKYAHSANPYDRKMVARIVQELFRTCPADLLGPDIPQIMEIIQHIGERDEAMVRADLLEQVPHMASQAKECSRRVEPLENVISDYLIPLVVRNLDRSENAVDKIAHSTLIHMLEQNLITKPQAEIQVCPAILALSNEEQASDINTGAMILMSKLAPLLGSDVTERVFLGRFVQLCSSETFYVRKICASIIGNFCAVVGKDKFITYLLPCYLKLCEDAIWGVKKSCAEVIMFVSAVCPPEYRRYSLAPSFAKLLKDDCRWVQMSAFQTLGPFIATFADPPVTSITFNKQHELVFVDKDGNEFTTNCSSNEYRLCRLVPKATPNTELNLNNCEDVGKIFEDDDDTVIDLYDNMDDNTQLTINESDKDIKEIVETVKNAVLCYRNPEPEQGFIGDNNINNLTNNSNNSTNIVINNDIINNRNDNCDNLGSTINDLNNDINKLTINNKIDTTSTTTTNTTTTATSATPSTTLTTITKEKDKNENINNNQVINGENNEDDLQMFNNHNYWYISPDIPIDLNILDNQGCINKNAQQNTNSELINNTENKEKDVTESRKLENVSDENESIEIPVEKRENNPASEEQEKLDRRPKEPPQKIVPQVLIDNFILMTDPSFSFYIDTEMSYHCAYSLPAVILTLGPENWRLIKDTVEALAIDLQFKVRRAVASSLHELAAILGTDLTTNDLTPIFEGFIKDLHEVRIGILKNLAKFLVWVKPDKRRTYLKRLNEFYDDTNWRFRHELARQLILLVPLFKPKDLADIAVIADGLLDDKVSTVRQIAISLVTELTKHLSQIPGLHSRWLVVLSETCAHSKNWKRRQTFASLCFSLLAERSIPPEQFATEVMPHLLDLSWDPVANVRLVVAKTISRHLMSHEYFGDPFNKHVESLDTVLKRLQADKDKDVRHAASGVDNDYEFYCESLRPTKYPSYVI